MGSHRPDLGLVLRHQGLVLAFLIKWIFFYFLFSLRQDHSLTHANLSKPLDCWIYKNRPPCLTKESLKIWCLILINLILKKKKLNKGFCVLPANPLTSKVFLTPECEEISWKIKLYFGGCQKWQLSSFLQVLHRLTFPGLRILDYEGCGRMEWDKEGTKWEGGRRNKKWTGPDCLVCVKGPPYPGRQPATGI